MVDDSMTTEQRERAADQDDFLKRVEDGKKGYVAKVTRYKKPVKNNSADVDINEKERQYQNRLKERQQQEQKPANLVNKKFQSSIKDLKTKKGSNSSYDEFNKNIEKLNSKQKNSVKKIFGD